MGGSVSKNVTKIVIDAVAKVSSKFIQSTSISYDASQLIYIKDTKGDVIIRGNKIIQHAYINMQALFNVMSSELAQQNLALELAQAAKSLTSGLNLGQFAYAENDMDIFIQTSIELTTEISQSCAETAKQEQRVIIEHTIGSVIIENNLFEQVANVFQDCLQTSISNSDALQSIILKLKQDSSASAEGISGWALVAMFALLIGVPTTAGVVGGKAVLQYIFPTLLVAGVIMIIVYFATRKAVMPVKAYSSFIKNTPACLPKPADPKPLLNYPTVESAGDYCLNTADCKAFDWKGINITETGSYTLVQPPETRIYNSVSSKCRSYIKEDNVNMLRIPVVFYGASLPPTSIPGLLRGDVWIDTRTSAWHQLTLAWVAKGNIVDVQYTKLTVQKTPPSASQAGVMGEVVVSYVEDDPALFHVYVYDLKNAKWIDHSKVTGPGLFAYAPSITNASAVKEMSGTPWLLYGGIAAVVVGAAGTVFTTVSKILESQQGANPGLAQELKFAAV